MLKGKCIILGISGGIASYKAVELLRQIVKRGAGVKVVMTGNAREFVSPLTFQTLSQNPVATELFLLLEKSEIAHTSLADQADILIIAPATANVIGKIVSGIADDLLTTTVMATNAPVLIAPSMNEKMYDNPVVRSNIERLKNLGYHLIEPGEGELACGAEGKGRLPEVGDIVEEVETLLSPKDLKGETILITAGPTREPIDPVRFIANRSSGKMGYALAKIARRRGAEVILVSGPVSLPALRGIRTVNIETASEMKEAVTQNYDAASAVVMAAAVADYRPEHCARNKIKKERNQKKLVVELEKNPDILEELGKRKCNKILIGFAAESEALIENAKIKLEVKNLDLIVANDINQDGAGFDVDTNIVKLIDREGKFEELPMMNKEEVADRILNKVVKIREAKKQDEPSR